MPTRILPAVGDADAVRSLTTLLSQLPDAEPVAPVVDSTQLIDTLARLAAESVDELPEVVVVHERIGPVPALELIREVALRFPAVGVILVTSDASPGLFQAAQDLVDRVVRTTVQLLDLLADLGRGAEEHPHFASGGEREHLLSVDVERVGCRDLEERVGHPERQHVEPPHQVLRKGVPEPRVDGGKVPYRETEPLGDGLEDLLVGREAPLDQLFPEGGQTGPGFGPEGLDRALRQKHLNRRNQPFVRKRHVRHTLR